MSSILSQRIKGFDLSKVWKSTHQLFHRNSSVLSYDILESSNGPSIKSKTVIMMHGVLGSKGNWRTFSRKIANTFTDWRVILVDHRAHGDSPSFSEPHTLHDCSRDLMKLIEHLGHKPDIVCGHSFGGKVALGYVEEAYKVNHSLPSRIWIFDAMPGKVEYKHMTSVHEVLSKIKSVPTPIPSKPHLVESLMNLGISEGEAQWMTTNIKQSEKYPNQYDWKLDIPVIETLFDSFLEADFWPLLQKTPTKIDFVRAVRNQHWKEPVLNRFSKLQNDDVTLHLLEDSDHWVHMDNPKGLFSLIAPTFQE